jgi:homocysteine S-methyltransferase
VDFSTCLRTAPLILTGGSMYERLRRRPDVTYDPDIAHSALVYDDAAREVVEEVHAEYCAVARRHALPMLVSASTWRASSARVARSRHATRAVNQDNVAFVRELTARWTDASAPLFVVGGLGPSGNAYRPEEALDAEAAARFHAEQVDALVAAAPDLLMAATLPAVSEARGIARLLGDAGLPYLVSFVVRDTGTLLDGTPLGEAMDRIDQECARPPDGYFVNCVHPQVLSSCLDAAGPAIAARVVGLRANTSTLRPEELDDAEELITQAPDELARHMLAARTAHGLTVVGGCCGTGTDHIEQMALTCKEAMAS